MLRDLHAVCSCCLSLQVKTVAPDLKPEQQAKVEWPVDAFAPFSLDEPNQLYITVKKKTVKVGETLDFQLHLSLSSDNYITEQVSYTVSHTLLILPKVSLPFQRQ